MPAYSPELSLLLARATAAVTRLQALARGRAARRQAASRRHAVDARSLMGALI